MMYDVPSGLNVGRVQQQTRVPAFMDDDDGPGFEYLEEEELKSEEDMGKQQQQQRDEYQTPPPEDDLAEFSILPTPPTISFPSTKPKTWPASKVVPPGMATAREQKERRRATPPHGRGALVQVVDVVDKDSECEIVDAPRGSLEGRRLAPKRPRTILTPTESNAGERGSSVQYVHVHYSTIPLHDDTLHDTVRRFFTHFGVSMYFTVFWR